jgi:phosphatidyl-myo-inositol dimannoside synthase
MIQRSLGIFPSLATVGGIQTSGRLAWEALRDAGGGRLFSYGSPTWKDPDGAQVISARTRAGAVASAFWRRWDPDLILVWHLHLVRLLPFLRASTARVALFLHGLEAWEEPGRRVRRLLGERVDLLLANSDYTAGRFLAFHPELERRTLRIIPLGWGAPLRFEPPQPVLPPAALVLGRMCRDEDYKGHRELITAWSLVQREIPEAELWLAGSGDLLPELRALAEGGGAGPSIRFFGEVSEAHKQVLLERCRCLVLPSRAEGFGLAYLEAMRAGRPCLTGDTDAGREVVRPPLAGLAADPSNAPGMARAVVELLTPGPQWDRWSASARQRYEAAYTAEKFKARLVDALGLGAHP